jgi:5-oxopent-3-ene-1,2,5-tricarboxylate decarboxylase / 2-hydroxyhepta-2,4-diene-1,7-dioate isomerase
MMTDGPVPDAGRGVPGHALAERLRAVGTAGLSTALRKRGYAEVFIDGVRAITPDLRIAGPARTLRFVPFRPDLLAERGGGHNAQKQAFDGVGVGEVLVIEARGLADAGTLGDILATRARARGAAGVVSDGAVRDAGVVAAIGLPVFAAGSHPSVLGRRHVPWEIDVVVACGGAAVVPGDFVVGDGDGVIVVPAAIVTEVLADAEAQELEDAWISDRVAEGNPIEGLFPMNATWRARYDAFIDQGA